MDWSFFLSNLPWIDCIDVGFTFLFYFIFVNVKFIFGKLRFVSQEIEAWMKENEGNESLLREFEEENTGEEATSQEFDSFLRKRAEAAQKRD